MPGKLPPARQSLTIGQQIAEMQRRFPSFKYRRNRGIPTWYGELQPIVNSPVYTVKIIYAFTGRYSPSPRVWIVSPEIHPNAPHRYADKSLCLYFPPERSWTSTKFIALTIVPWAAAWLAFYEIWLDTDHWYGPEAPHTGVK